MLASSFLDPVLGLDIPGWQTSYGRPPPMSNVDRHEGGGGCGK